MKRCVMPESYALRRFYWQLFVTLTFSKPPQSRAHSLPKVFAWLRETAALARIHFRRFFWVLRYEYGSCGCNGHYHLCLAGLPPALLAWQLCCALESKWWTGAGGLSE